MPWKDWLEKNKIDRVKKEREVRQKETSISNEKARLKRICLSKLEEYERLAKRHIVPLIEQINDSVFGSKSVVEFNMPTGCEEVGEEYPAWAHVSMDIPGTEGRSNNDNYNYSVKQIRVTIMCNATGEETIRVSNREFPFEPDWVEKLEATLMDVVDKKEYVTVHGY